MLFAKKASVSEPAPETLSMGDMLSDGSFVAATVLVDAQGNWLPDGLAYTLIVAPKAAGEHADTVWNHTTAPVEANSYTDGLANTLAMAKAGSELARWALELRIGGHSDWCIPSLVELHLCWAAREYWGTEAFDEASYWASTQHRGFSDSAYHLYFATGFESYTSKGAFGRARAVRKVKIPSHADVPR